MLLKYHLPVIRSAVGMLMLTLLSSLPSVQAEPVHLPGKFVWAELVTDNTATAKRFYGDLFGWTFDEVDGYITAYNHDEAIGGIFFYPRPKDSGAKPRWLGYVSVGDTKLTGRSVQASGGSIQAAQRKLPGQNAEAMVLADSEGALFGVVHFAEGDPPDYLADTGDWIWIQLLSRDVKKASTFYQQTLGYELVNSGQINGSDKFLFVSEGYARAALMAISPQRQDVMPSWLPFLRVDSVSATITKALQIGGKVLLAPRPKLFSGRAAVIEDPTGGVIGIMEWDAQQEEAR